MFDIGWMELLIIGVVALIVIGPKDLPEMFRTLGRFTAKLRAMAREFQRAMEDAAKESGVKDVARDINTLASPKNMGLEAVKSAADKFEKWDPLKGGTRPAAAATKAATPAPAAGAASAAGAGAAGTVPAAEASAAAAAGPNTAALAEKVAAKRAATAARAAERRAKPADAPAAAPAPSPVKRGGRVRKKADAGSGGGTGGGTGA